MKIFILLFCLISLGIGFKMPDLKASQNIYNIRAKRSPQEFNPIGAGIDIMQKSIQIPAQAAQAAAGTVSGAAGTFFGGSRERRNIRAKKSPQRFNPIGAGIDIMQKSIQIPAQAAQAAAGTVSGAAGTFFGGSRERRNVRAERSPQGFNPIGAGIEIMQKAIQIPANAIAQGAGTISGAAGTFFGGSRQRRNVHYDKLFQSIKELENLQNDMNNNNHLLNKRDADESYDEQEKSIFFRFMQSINNVLANFMASASEFVSNLRNKMQADPEEQEEP